MIVGFGDYRARARAAARPGARSSPGRSSTATSCTCSPLADVTVVPSIFPEAFGMVAAEAAAAGSPPLVARHSGLAEVAAGLEEEYPEHLRRPRVVRDRRRRRARPEAERAPGAAAGPIEPRSPRPRAARRSSAGAGRASRGACSSRSTSLSALMGDEQQLLPRGSRALRRRHRLHASPSRRSSRSSTRARSTSSTASRTCTPRRRTPRWSRTSSAS